MTRADLTGRTFGHLTVIGPDADHIFPSGQRRARWHVRCKCGTTTSALVGNLRSGHTSSCGHCQQPGPNGGSFARQETVRYIAAHVRVSTERGRAREHMCADCGGPAREWSYDHKDPDELTQMTQSYGGRERLVAYSLKSEHYTPLCRSCHVRFDRWDRKRDLLAEGGVA